MNPNFRELTPTDMTDEHLARTLRETITDMVNPLMAECAQRGITVKLMDTSVKNMAGAERVILSVAISKPL